MVGKCAYRRLSVVSGLVAGHRAVAAQPRDEGRSRVMTRRRSAVAIWWNPSRGATLGVEWELQLIDATTKLLRQDAREVISALRRQGEAGREPRIHDELMQSTVEVVTGVCSTVSEAVG